MLLKTPLYIVSYCLLALVLVIFVITYLIHNKTRVIDSKGGKNIKGYLRCLGEDIALAFAAVCAFLAVQWQAFVVWFTLNKNQLRNRYFNKDGSWFRDKYFHKDGSWKKKKEIRDKYFNKDGSWKKKGGDDDDNHGDEEQPYTKGKKKKKSSKSKSKTDMLADDHDITIKSNSNSTEESDDSYVKIADDIEGLTNNTNVSHTPTTKATTVASSSTSSSSNTFGKKSEPTSSTRTPCAQ